MKTELFFLTKNEREIMNLLWQEGRDLTRREIIALSPERSWKEASIHILLNQLLDKGAIAVEAFVRVGKNYGRTFKAVVSESQYFVMQIEASDAYRHSGAAAIVNIFDLLIKDIELDEESLQQMQAMIEAKRVELMEKASHKSDT